MTSFWGRETITTTTIIYQKTIIRITISQETGTKITITIIFQATEIIIRSAIDTIIITIIIFWGTEITIVDKKIQITTDIWILYNFLIKAEVILD